MAVVLNKIANAENARAKPRPPGLSGILADSVALTHRAKLPLLLTPLTYIRVGNQPDSIARLASKNS